MKTRLTFKIDTVIIKVVEKALITDNHEPIQWNQEIKRERNTNITDGTKYNTKHVECQ